MKTVAVIVNWNRAALTEMAARSVETQVDRVVVVDNASEAADRSAVAVLCEERGYAFLPQSANLGYAGGNNVGIAYALGSDPDGLLVLNNDVVLEPGCVESLCALLMEDPEIGVVAPVEISPKTGLTVHTACFLNELSTNVKFAHRGVSPGDLPRAPLDTDYVAGSAFLARADVFRRCGSFDERYFCYFEDSDWSLRVRRAGWRLKVHTAAIALHRISASTPKATTAFYMARNRPVFIRRTLGRSRLLAIALSVPPTLMFAAALARSRSWWGVLMGSARGWCVGVLETIREDGPRPEGPEMDAVRTCLSRKQVPSRAGMERHAGPQG